MPVVVQHVQTGRGIEVRLREVRQNDLEAVLLGFCGGIAYRARTCTPSGAISGSRVIPAWSSASRTKLMIFVVSPIKSAASTASRSVKSSSSMAISRLVTCPPQSKKLPTHGWHSPCSKRRFSAQWHARMLAESGADVASTGHAIFSRPPGQ